MRLAKLYHIATQKITNLFFFIMIHIFLFLRNEEIRPFFIKMRHVELIVYGNYGDICLSDVSVPSVFLRSFWLRGASVPYRTPKWSLMNIHSSSIKFVLIGWWEKGANSLISSDQWANSVQSNAALTRCMYARYTSRRGFAPRYSGNWPVICSQRFNMHALVHSTVGFARTTFAFGLS